MHVKEPRDLTEVLAQMLDLIPESEKDLRERLSYIRDSAFYTPPETMSGQWRFALDALIQYIGEPKTEWQIQVCELFGGRKRPTQALDDESATTAVRKVRGVWVIEVAHCFHCKRLVLGPQRDECSCGAELYPVKKLVPIGVPTTLAEMKGA